ncbi:MAG: hypothetical protein ACR2NX_04300 [Chthoniobacterales bacterium]
MECLEAALSLLGHAGQRLHYWGAHYQGDKLFQILKTYAEHDQFDPKLRCQVLEREARWSNGSTCDKITAANQAAGRSATYQIIVATELAYWHEEGVADAASVLAGLMKTVENAPRTMIDLESTANGAAGVFYEKWQDAITFQDLKAGRRGFVRVFAPWFAFEDSRRDPKLEEQEEQIVPPNTVEDLRRRYNLDDEQIAWMQWACREECKKDFDIFCEEYPFDDISAFRTSGRRRFNVRKIEAMVERVCQNPPAFGVLDVTKDGQRERVTWRPAASDEVRVLRWEQPQSGMKYLISVDSMTGETQVGGKDPDNHAAGVLRAGFFQSGKGWVPPKLVARLVDDWGAWERNRKYQLRWDIDILEEEIWRLTQYYGNAMIVPEMNMDRGLVELLKLRSGANITSAER